MTRIATSAYSGCTCDRLRKAARLASRLYDKELEPVGINVGQWSLLSQLRKSGGSSMKSLAESLAMDRTTVTRNLKPLQRDALVEIAQAEDRRVSIVRLTKKGAALWESALPLWEKAQIALHRRLGGETTVRLRQLLEHTIVTLEEVERV